MGLYSAWRVSKDVTSDLLHIPTTGKVYVNMHSFVCVRLWIVTKIVVVFRFDGKIHA